MTPTDRVVRVCLVAVAIQGISHVTTQLVLLREMLTVYSGNELVIGVLLGCWLLLSGIGAGLGRLSARARDPFRLVSSAGLGVAVLPTATVSALRVLRNVVFTRGAEVGLLETLASSLLLLAPYCVITGFTVTLASTAVGQIRPHASRIGLVYVADGMGDVAGGAAFGFVLAEMGNHYVTLVAVGVIVALGSAGLALRIGHRGLGLVSVAVALGLTTLGLAVDLDRSTLRWLYPGRTILAHESSAYGDLVVSESSGQIDWLENGVPLASSQDRERVEEVVHFPLVQRPAARNVLLVGGTVSGAAEKILSYPGISVDCVELDPALLALRKQFVGPNSEGRLHFIESDARSFIRQTGQHYDVLIVDLPDPSTAQLNRYYTREFFAEAKQRLNPGGVLSLSIGTYANYVSAELGRLFGITRSTLQSSFSNVVFIPTERVTVLGSDGPLHLDIAARLRARGIRTEWVTEPMLAATLSPDRLRDIAGAARAPAPVNSDFSPSLQAATLKHWLGRFDVAPVGWLLGFAATAFGVVVLLGRIPLVVSIVGFAAAGLEVLLLLGLQITRGAVYSAAALVVTAYLLGSALGATQANRYEPAAPTRAMAAALVALGAFAFGCPPALAWLGEQPAQGLVARAAFPTAAALLGALAGGVFPWAARADFRGVAPTAARLLAADLVGASLGALLIATLLLPRFGVTYTATSVGLLCFLGAVAAAVPSLRLLYRSRP